MAAKKPRPVTTQDALLRRIPGWKLPTKKAEVGPDGEPIVAPVDPNVKVPREFLLPDMKDITEMTTKDDKDQYR